MLPGMWQTQIIETVNELRKYPAKEQEVKIEEQRTEHLTPLLGD